MPVIHRTRLFKLAFITLLFVSLGTYAADRDVRVLNYEPVALDFGTLQTSGVQKTSSIASTLRFSAFGKSYSAALAPNASITVPANSTAVAYKGSIDGRANSW